MSKSKNIFERIHRIELQVKGASKDTINVFVIEDSEPMMIDVGPLTKENKNRIEEGLEAIGYHKEDIRRIVLTHGHIDHFGMAPWIWKQGKPTIFIHQNDANKIGEKHEWELPGNSERVSQVFLRLGVPYEEFERIRKFILKRRKYIKPIQTYLGIDESFIFDFSDFQLRIIHFPGHTAGSICLWNEETGLLFSGDSLLPGTIPVPLIELRPNPLDQCYTSLFSYLKTVKQIQNLNIRVVYPGHGEIIHNVNEIYMQIFNYWERRKKEVLDLFGEGKTLPYQIVQKLLLKHKKYKEYVPYIKLSEVVGVLEVLEKEGLVESFGQESRVWYQKSKN